MATAGSVPGFASSEIDFVDDRFGTSRSDTTVTLTTDIAPTGGGAIQAKLWPATQAQPANWQVSTTNSTAALLAAGNVGLKAYLSGTASPSPVIVKFADYGVVAVP
jgi:hypothetical protein